ncbi:hypothetical protein EJB05_47024 [Eragrostis curvula]|uniref:Uncharacterized protein n=1 Tax=Eragrostis curvula TaxID=38414 RepID=A0A5J9T6H7_9POAL|nr:hypothetical protein EJB05_47024 [Eragrostis curvula]
MSFSPIIPPVRRVGEDEPPPSWDPVLTPKDPKKSTHRRHYSFSWIKHSDEPSLLALIFHYGIS